MGKLKKKVQDNELEEYEFLRDKLAKVFGGDKKRAEEILKEAMIQEVSHAAKDGINIFIADDETRVKFNSFPHVEI